MTNKHIVVSIFALMVTGVIILLVAGENIGDTPVTVSNPPLQSEPESVPSDSKPIIIVPDTKTFVYYISAWSQDERFPVFVGMDTYAEKFAAVYNNGNNYFKYVDAKEIGALTKRTIYRALLASFGTDTLDTLADDGSAADLKSYFSSNNIVPEGIVLTDLSSPELFGGLALAAYHGQLLDFLRIPTPPLIGPYSEDTKELIRKDILRMLDGWGFEYRGLGKGIDAITLAVDMPIKYGGGMSLDDAINRLTPDSTRCYAYTGRLMDLGKGLAVYQAMCSLFLDTNRALFFDKWPQQWGRTLKLGCYEIRRHIPAVVLRDDLEKWHAALGVKNTYDLIFVNAAGYPHEWTGGTVDDIPDSLPVAVNFSHSSSANDPSNPDTIAGRWLINGAFAYYGSISEPYADSFNTSYNIVRRLNEGMPFARAAAEKSTLPKNRAKPWKLIFIGDPLFRPRYRVDSEDEQFFTVMKTAIQSLESLQFGQAQEVLESYINIPREQVDDELPYTQAREYLERVYELMACEAVYRSYLQQQYSANFIASWMADYPTIIRLKKQMYRNEQDIIDAYMQIYSSVAPVIEKKSFLKLLWQDIRYTMRRRVTYIPQWHVISSIPEESLQGAQWIEKILASDLQQPVTIDQNQYVWRDYPKDPLSNYLEVQAGKNDTRNAWVAVATFRAQEPAEAMLRVFAKCAADIYIDNEHVTEYADSIRYTWLNKPIEVSQGDHRIVVVLRPRDKRPGELGICITGLNDYYSTDTITFPTDSQ